MANNTAKCFRREKYTPVTFQGIPLPKTSITKGTNRCDGMHKTKALIMITGGNNSLVEETNVITVLQNKRVLTGKN